MYRARDPITGSELIIKVFDFSNRYYGNSCLNRAYRFVLNQSLQLKHENFVAVHDWGDKDGRPFIVMDEGETLYEIIKAGQAQSLPFRLKIIEQVCNGLQLAHQQGIRCHLDDTKVFVLPDGTARILLIDFPDELLTDVDLEAPAAPMRIYMAPEQIFGWGTDARSPIFNIGLLLFEVITGKHPFTSDDPHYRHDPRTLIALIDCPHPPLGAFTTNYPPALNGIVARALAKEPQDRYQTAEAMAADLRAVISSLERAEVSN